MEDKKYLVEFGENNDIRFVCQPNELKEKVKEAFSIQEPFLLKVFDKDFKKWVGVPEIEKLPTLSELKVFRTADLRKSTPSTVTEGTLSADQKSKEANAEKSYNATASTNDATVAESPSYNGVSARAPNPSNTQQQQTAGLITFNTTDNASVDMRNVNASDGDMTVNEHLYKQDAVFDHGIVNKGTLNIGDNNKSHQAKNMTVYNGPRTETYSVGQSGVLNMDQSRGKTYSGHAVHYEGNTGSMDQRRYYGTKD